MYCPYCDARASRSIGWYFDCEEGHTFHIGDWPPGVLREGAVA